MAQKYSRIACIGSALGVLLIAAQAVAQPVVRLPQSAGGASGAGVYPPSTPGTVPFTPGSTPGTLGTPNFDPYAANPGAVPPPLPSNGAPSSLGTPLPSGVSPPPGTTTPYPGAAPGTLGGPATTPYGQPYQPYGVYPPGATPGTTPPALFPNGLNTPAWGAPAMRFITPRVRYTWVRDGGGADDLGINDFDFSAAMAFPNFLYSTQPLYVVPAFSLHLWSGPRPPIGQLPANAYSAFLDFGWSTDPTKQLSGEVGARFGVFSDFHVFNTNSFRIMGQGLFRLQTTPTMAVRGGVIYLDRNKIKLLPAGGILWTPNAQTRFDIFFPRPKLSQQLTTLGTHDLWWYVAGEYGGGAWTIKNAGFPSDRIDINDIRLMLGIEWGQPALLQKGRRTGFVEFGWVTDREIVYVVDPHDVALGDSFMVRAGWNY